jgi:hypothetical protein
MRKLTGVLGSVRPPAPAEPFLCLEPARFLLCGIRETDLAMTTLSLRWWDFRAQAIWVLDLFERLEHRNNAATPTSAERMTA